MRTTTATTDRHPLDRNGEVAAGAIMRGGATSAPAGPETALRTYVLDTSVPLSDPHALRKFAEHNVVLPLVVINELEAKRHHPELGWFARTALRQLEELRYRHGRLDLPVPANEDGGTLQVELNHTDPSVLPAGFRNDANDHRILACALNFRAEGHETVLVTKDIPLRVKAGAVGLPADEYHAQDVVVTSTVSWPSARKFRAQARMR